MQPLHHRAVQQHEPGKEHTEPETGARVDEGARERDEVFCEVLLKAFLEPEDSLELAAEDGPDAGVLQ